MKALIEAVDEAVDEVLQKLKKAEIVDGGLMVKIPLEYDTGGDHIIMDPIKESNPTLINTDPNDQKYISGYRDAYGFMLIDCLKILGYDECHKNGWIIERESAIAILRAICEDFGDNDWKENLSLNSIIEKHLYCYLLERREGAQENERKTGKA